MADIKQDLLSLQYSQNFDIQGMQEVNVDLELPPASVSLATVYGVVTDGTAPIADATVKLFDSAGQPYQHTMTDASGAYTLSGIPAGTYSLGAVKDGYLLSDAAGVTLSAGATTQMNLTCTPEASLSLGAIAGVLTVSDSIQAPPPLWPEPRSPCRMLWAPLWPPPTPPQTASLPSMIWRTGSIPCSPAPMAMWPLPP